MMMPIVWNPAKEKWCVYDASGKELWSTEKYVDAVTFVDDYVKQQAIKNALTVGSVRD